MTKYLLMTMLIMIPGIANALQSVEVFTVAGKPVYGATKHAVVVEIDAAARLDADFSYGLSSDPQEAFSQIKEKISVHGPELYQRYKDSYIGLTRARVLGVLKVPAVVVDSKYVVYGVYDIEKALRIIASYNEGR